MIPGAASRNRSANGLARSGVMLTGVSHQRTAGWKRVEDFPHLRQCGLLEVLVVVAVLRWVPFRRVAVVAAAGVRPILRLRVIQAELQAVRADGVGEGRNEVAVRGVDALTAFQSLTCESYMRKAVVMLRGDDDVFHARVAREVGPRLGIIFRGGEVFAQRLVLG